MSIYCMGSRTHDVENRGQRVVSSFRRVIRRSTRGVCTLPGRRCPGIKAMAGKDDHEGNSGGRNYRKCQSIFTSVLLIRF